MEINQKDFVGKTIASLDTRAVNEVVFHFTDGTTVALETECALPSLGLYGIAQVAPKLTVQERQQALREAGFGEELVAEVGNTNW